MISQYMDSPTYGMLLERLHHQRCQVIPPLPQHGIGVPADIGLNNAPVRLLTTHKQITKSTSCRARTESPRLPDQRRMANSDGIPMPDSG